jgi:hypothetical protein
MDGLVNALAVLPTGDVVAAGTFATADGLPASRIARWDGVSWSAIGSGTNSVVWSLALLDNGQLAVGGEFTVAGGLAASCLAYLTTTCPATAQRYGAGCASSAGVLDLSALSLPWEGSTYTSRTTGMPRNGIGFSMLGMDALSAPVPSFLTLHQPGGPCRLLLWPDVVELGQPVSGSLDFSIPVPASPSLIGVPFHQQTMSLQLRLLPPFFALATSNGLELVVGRF